MKQFLFLGDSITDCGHAFDYEDLGEGYVRMIWNNFHLSNQKVQVLNRGTDGFTIKNLKRLWNISHEKYKPDTINILIGINDIGVIQNAELDSAEYLAAFEKNYDELLTQIRETCDCPITLMEPFVFTSRAKFINWLDDVHKMSDIIKGLAEKHNLTFIPLWDKLLKACEEHGYDYITVDGIHLTKQGQKIIAETWLDWYKG